jgi:hypothetical protein
LREMEKREKKKLFRQPNFAMKKKKKFEKKEKKVRIFTTANKKHSHYF